ncbi:alpha/beta hydrolase [Streptomyces griseoviridis]|uniref:Hydrolase signal peptide protein n=2 Tax=Streptomyces TaxID=1883 RepID=A0A918GA32_STRGD|nr:MULTISPECIES: alpha/beta hydrolase [Streptomyces]GGS26034.1 hydrolase signal peptide protein [Streptomyces niveoruber]GGU40826.1 hydrolase signal peptide protein [Streptomyces daghestanicus]
MGTTMGELTTNDGVRLTYRDSGGDGVPLVMLHGWGQTQEMFRHQVTGLAPGRRVVTLDQRGHGISGKPHHGYRIARLARDVLGLVDHLGLDRFDALGWSMGVSVWWSFIDQWGTGRIRRFVAVDQPAAVAAVPWMSAEEQRDSGAIFDVSGLLELATGLAGPDGERVRQEFVRGMFSGSPDPGLLAFVAEQIRSTPAYAGVPLLFDHCAQDWRDVLPRVDVPTLVIACDGSHVDPASQRYVADRIPDARLHTFPTTVASSHFPFLENPAAFNAVVDAFLAEGLS